MNHKKDEPDEVVDADCEVENVIIIDTYIHSVHKVVTNIKDSEFVASYGTLGQSLGRYENGNENQYIYLGQ